ncbi:phosphoethanolamine transferase [Ichthyenterobacterium magnum]|uniref:Phosphatidylethanolamine:Kdo2-lipid A phosphoethanolamine transferase n=1 Tax=Ichthyenterobacterium magnum TaxID=1230530 RepID=A0A420DX46_9FLAO|nr:phosphoethanolamine transferase [Ichthyenterobacterium magnum]RKE98795.1 phosphatidylethanolamine:Kdo2-lipid A phosphoethanolamine transferase [Ichthyenterobacterium magnum]
MAELKNSIFTFFKKHKKQILFHLFLNSCFLLCITLASYIHIPLSGFKDRLMYFVHILLLQFTVAGFIYFLTLNKWLFRVVFCPIFFLLSLFSFWVYTQDISITNTLIQSVFETKASIVSDLLSFQYILFMLLIIAVLIALNIIYNKVKPVSINIPFVVIALVCIYTFKIVESKRYNTLRSRLPYNIYFGIKDYYKQDTYVLDTISKSVFSGNNDLKIVLVLGETVRADHLQLNGYNRETTPLLSAKKNVLSFNNITTQYTNTATSLPRIITNLGINSSDKTNKVISVFDVFKQCDYDTFWIGNQELENSYGFLAKSNKKVVLVDSLRSVLSFNKALDEELLQPFKKAFFKDKNSLITLHMMGSHWWYENRYSDAFRKFKPVIDSKHIPSLSSEQMINSYDNTILYLDNFLNKTISVLEESDETTLLIYISDHGEILGEDGKWLHSQKSEAAKNPAMLVWYSDKFKENFTDKAEALHLNKNNSFTTDIIYHSLLDLIDVNKIEYDKNESIFNAKETPTH